MLRYCTNCKKDYDFEPLAVSGKDKLICPECGNVIDKNSRNPANKEGIDATEERIGHIYARLLHLSYIFYLVMGVIGVVCFVLGLRRLLYAATLVSLLAYIIQLVTRYITFASGIVLIPLGAMVGYVYFNSVDGACLGVHVVFLVRHLIRDIILRLVFSLIRHVSGA